MTNEQPDLKTSDADDTTRLDEPFRDDRMSQNEPEDDGRQRPRLAVIIGSVLLLVAIGTGLAFLIPSGSIREVDQLNPTLVPTAVSQTTDGVQSSTPEPLPIAIGTYSSTETIAEVGDSVIVRGDFVRLYQPGTDPAELLEQLIQIELVIQAAATEGVSIDSDMIDGQVAEIKASQGGGNDQQFLAFLDQVQVGDEVNLRRLLERDQLVEKMILKHTLVEQARARHILIATSEGSDPAELKAEAEELLSQLKAGADFAALAAEHSDDPGSGATGGDLGWAPRGVYVTPFDEAVFSMTVGELRIVETDFGFHIIELLDAPQTQSLEDPNLLQSPAGQQAFADTFMPWVDSLQQEAEQNQRIKIIIPAEQLVSLPTNP